MAYKKIGYHREKADHTEIRKRVDAWLLEGLSFAEIGRKLGITRQRVHQIYTGYSTIVVKNTLLESIYKKAWKDMCQHCFKSKSKHMHHRDGDHTNNTVSNLLPVCYRCHYGLHQVLRILRTKVDTKCDECEKPISYLRGRVPQIPLCGVCLSYFLKRKKNPYKGKHIRKHEITTHCSTCGAPFIKNSLTKYSQHNRCHRCINRDRKAKEKGDPRMKIHLKNYYLGLPVSQLFSYPCNKNYFTS